MTIKVSRRLINLIAPVLTLCLLAAAAKAQSTDVSAPSPIRTSEIAGEIAARDIGDARLTDHYYAFTGTPGDLLITVDGRNINGDVDIFTATGLRPLLKFSLYAESTSPVTKSIYLRTTEQLILRIEGRTPNDDTGVYHFRFGGSFEPITTAPLVSETATAVADPLVVAEPARKKGRRVSSVGARIQEPAELEVAAAPTPEPSPEVAEPKSAEPVESKPATARAPSRTNRGRRLPGRRTRTPPAATEETVVEKAKPSDETDTTVEKPAEVAARPSPRGKPGSRRGAATPPPAEPAAEPQVETGPRLIIETNDGTLINRYMSSVRRVTVENGRVVVIGKDGKIERFALDTVVRMSIAP